MPFIIEIDLIENNSRRIMPISMNQRYHSGERFQALIEWVQGSNTTILIADYLQRHNLNGDEKKALKQGKNFLKQHDSILKNCIVIQNDAEWEAYKDLPVLKLMRWKTWADIHPQQFAAAQLLIEEQSSEGSAMLLAMKRTAASCFSIYSEESSIAYQKEENAYLLTFMTCFDDHIYPKFLNDSQTEIYKQFHETLPKHRVPHFVTLRQNNMDVRRGFWAGASEDTSSSEEKKAFSPPKEKRSLHPMLRMALMNFEMAISSSEVPPNAKIEFAQQCKKLLAASGLPLEADLEDSPKVEAFSLEENHPM